MAPSYVNLSGQQRLGGPSQSRSAVEDGRIHSNSPAHRIHNEESWVEISSQPSSSSLSSIGDEIITTGLRVQQNPHVRRRRRNNTTNLLPRHTSTSSQDEYDESESDDDNLLSSSAEQIPSPAQRLQHQSSYDAGSESGSSSSENLTTLGTRAANNQPAFTPQPNVFSQLQPRRNTEADSYFSRVPPTRPSYSDRHSYPARNDRPQHTPYNVYSPSHQADHDAALRASLTTLLSCAAAARGLPKRSAPTSNQTQGQQPTGLRMVPESALLAPSRPSSPADSKPADTEKGKRKTGKQDGVRAAKKKKTVGVVSEETGLVSPTLLTWVVSAGVVVLVSAIGFSAGYAMGREVGRQEAIGLGSAGGLEGSCGKEVSRATGGLRRFRLGVTV